MKKNEEGIKVIFLGEIFVGKTSLIKISIGKKFNEKEAPSLSANYVPKKFKFNKKTYTFNLWDTAGDEKFHSLTKLFFMIQKL